MSEETARVIDAEVQRIIEESHDQALRLITGHRKALDALADALLARETLGEQGILEVTRLPPAPALETRKMQIGSAAAPGAVGAVPVTPETAAGADRGAEVRRNQDTGIRKRTELG